MNYQNAQEMPLSLITMEQATGARALFACAVGVHAPLVAGSGGYCVDSTRYCAQYPRGGSQESFYWWKMGGWNPRDGMPFRGDSNTHASETPRSRAHIKAEISRLENNFGCLGELVNGLCSNCYLTPLLMMLLLTGVMIKWPDLPIDRVLKSKSSKNNFPQNFTLYLLFYPVFSLQKPCSTRLQCPDFTPISSFRP